MKKWIWLIIGASFLLTGIGAFIWYRKRSNAGPILPGEQGAASDSLLTSSGSTGSHSTTQSLDGEKNLKQSCISTICPYSNEAEDLQRRLNAYLPKMNKILANDIEPVLEREKGIKKRFDKLFIDGKMVLKFQTGTNQVEALKVDGKFGKKTEQMLYLAIGKTETSLNSLVLTLDKDSNQQQLYSLT